MNPYIHLLKHRSGKIVFVISNSCKNLSNKWLNGYLDIHHLIRRFFPLVLVSGIIGCSHEKFIPPPSFGQQQLDKTIEVLGGKNVVMAVNTVSYNAVSSAYEWEQTTPVEPDPVYSNETRYKFSSVLNKRKARIDYSYIDHDKPFQYPTYFGKVIINDQRASISGEYNWLSYYFGQTYVQAMHASRLEAMLKTQMMANPIEMIRQTIINKENGIPDLDNNPLTLPTRIRGLDMEILLDSITYLPKSAKIMEEDFLNGDVMFEVKYENWVTVANSRYPSRLSYFLRDKIIKKEALTNVEFNPLVADSFFKTETPVVPLNYDNNNADRGFLFSQWHNRWIAWGILIDQPLDNGALVLERYDLSGVDIPNQHVGDNLKIIGRPDLRTWCIAIKTSQGIIAVEPPLNTYWTNSILKTIEAEFPNQPIIAGIATHTHHVSFGGVREMAQKTGKIYVGASGLEVAKTAIKAKHSLVPDALELKPRPVEIIPVSSKMDLVNGEVQIYPLKTSHAPTDLSGPHSDDMVVVYVPQYHALIQCDMLWTGEYMEIWYHRSTNGFTPKAKAELKRRARYLVDFINEKNLNVDKIISVHGGLASMQELYDVAYR